MKRILLLSICIMFGLTKLNAQTLAKKIYVDFGPTGGTNAAITPSPDANGFYWNNATNASVGSVTALIDDKNAATGYNMTVTDDFTVNTTTNFGPNGTTQANLGDLAVDTATRDYFYLDSANGFPTGQLTISNLNPVKGYKFSIFASRPTTSTRITQFVFNGLTSYNTQVQTSDGSTGNTTTLVNSPILYPNNLGVITIDLSIISGGYGYINSMKMEEYVYSTSIGVTSLTVSGNDITGNGQTSQMTVAVTPTNATSPQVIWTVDNSNIAIINSSGLLRPLTNGSVVVTATNIENSSISNSKTINISNLVIDDHKISIMGSSVAFGIGATLNQGYAYKYGQILGDRFTAGTGSEWNTSNISISGNNTTDLLNRYETDLLGDFSKYVIYGLSLGNEGIHESGQPSFVQFRDNMLSLIAKARTNGKIPVITNNYSRADYSATDYNYIKEMNMLIQQWDLPSVNFLGAIDNGSGQWATGYQYDDKHPNDAGHNEFLYAMVPSLFDALEQQKPLPQIVTGTSISINNQVPAGALKFKPENMIHPFTMSFDIKTASTGNVALFTTSSAALGTLTIDANGHLSYTSPSGTSITGTDVVNDNQWHKITFTHFYARGESILYTDNVVSGSINEKLEAKVFSLNPANAPTSIQYRNWFFYRSGMNNIEINALSNGQMLKSSLELYAPLDGQGVIGGSPYVNLAQSTNTIDSANFLLGLCEVNFKTEWQYVNPVKEFFTVYTDNVTIKKLEVYNTLGAFIKAVNNSKTIDMSSLAKGVYLIKIYSDTDNSTIKVIKY
jgi:lysophospholipase L1-like esterase